MLGPLEIALGCLPGVLWLAWIHKKDDWEPEPRGHVALVFVLGAVAAFAIAHSRPRIESIVPYADGLAGHVLDAFVATAVFEELAKLAVIVAAASWRREWDEPLDGVVYGAAAGLGFASLENAYFLATEGGVGVLAARAFTSTLLHVACSSIAGFAVGLGRLRKRPLAGAVIGLGLAVVPHGFYDLFVYGVPAWSTLALLVVLPVMLAVLSVCLRWARAQSPQWHPQR